MEDQSPAIFIFESLLDSSVSSFVHRVTRLMRDEGAAHCARITDVVALWSDSLYLDLQLVADLLRTAAVGRVFTASPETPETPSPMPLRRGKD